MKTKLEQIEEIAEVLAKSQKRCRNITDVIFQEHYARVLVEAGYGDVSEYKAEIKRLKSEYEQLQTNAEILARGVRDLNHENYELTEKIKQVQIDILNELKTKTHNYYPSIDSYCMSQHVVLVRDIDELIKEIEK